ncbi:hypothetical protein [Actinophytocola sediminis]
MTERHLRDLGAHLDVPPPPAEAALTAAVLARLDHPRPRPGLLPRLAAVAVALLVALGVAMAASPAVRAAVLDFLRIGAVELTHAPAPPAPATPAPLPGDRVVTLEQARAQATFPLRVPALLGDPSTVHLADGDPPRVVTLSYDGVRVDQVDGGLDPMFQKFTHVPDAVPTTVDGAPGIWLPTPHPVLYLDRDGHRHERSARLAGTTLVWEQDGLTYRVEGDLTHRQAVAIAESMTD